MITKVQAYSTASGVFNTIGEAKKAEVGKLLTDFKAIPDGTKAATASFIVDNENAIIDILTTTKNSKPSARKINGGTKRRRPSIPSPQAARTPQDVSVSLAAGALENEN